jgi:hypothetical protein
MDSGVLDSWSACNACRRLKKQERDFSGSAYVIHAGGSLPLGMSREEDLASTAGTVHGRF